MNSDSCLPRLGHDCYASLVRLKPPARWHHNLRPRRLCVVIGVLEPRQHLVVQLRGVTHTGTVGDHGVPIARRFKATRWLYAFKLDTQIESRPRDLHDPELAALAQETDIAIGRRYRHTWAKCLEFRHQFVEGFTPSCPLAGEALREPLIGCRLWKGCVTQRLDNGHGVSTPQPEIFLEPGNDGTSLDTVLQQAFLLGQR